MNEILDKIVTDEHLAWDKTLMDKKQQFVVNLNSEIIDELVNHRNELENIDADELPLLKNKILYFKIK